VTSHAHVERLGNVLRPAGCGHSGPMRTDVGNMWNLLLQRLLGPLAAGRGERHFYWSDAQELLGRRPALLDGFLPGIPVPVAICTCYFVHLLIGVFVPGRIGMMTSRGHGRLSDA
jgi:hypothetical protein